MPAVALLGLVNTWLIAPPEPAVAPVIPPVIVPIVHVKVLGAEEEKAMLDEIKGRYETQTSPYYAAARLWVDGIIDPAKTRQVIAEAIKAADHNPNIAEFKIGVFQV